MCFVFLIAVYGCLLCSVILAQTANSNNVDKKTIMVMVDNRQLQRDWNAADKGYFSLSSVINYEFAKKHGYAFVIFKINSTHLVEEVTAKYKHHANLTEALETISVNNKAHPDWGSATKLEITAFNKDLRQYRSSPWSKLQIFWMIAMAVHHRYGHWDRMFYIDSDMVINPQFHSRSLDDMINERKPKYPNLDSRSLVFFSNHPYNSYPCSGAIIFNLANAKLPELLLMWWNFNNKEKNFAHEFEQATLWELIDLMNRNPSLQKGNNNNLHRPRTFEPDDIAVVQEEHQFPPCNDNWLCHLGHPWLDQRMVTLTHMVETQLHVDPSMFAATIDHLSDKATVHVEAFHLSEVVGIKSESSVEELNKIKKFAHHIAIHLPGHTSSSSRVIGHSNLPPTSTWRDLDIQVLKSIQDRQFPSSCREKKAMVLNGMQATGLGTIVAWQLTSLLKAAMMKDLVLIFNESMTSSYFYGCPENTIVNGRDVVGHWECMFQPITNCTVDSVLEVAEVVPMSCGSHEEIPFTFQERQVYRYFLIGRPSDVARRMVLDLFNKQLGKPWNLQRDMSIGVHVRQGIPHSKESRDHVRKNKRVWHAKDLLQIMQRVSSVTGLKRFIVVSDDSALPRDVKAEAPKDFQVAYISDLVAHAKEGDMDCVRLDEGLGCDQSIGLAKAAYAVMLDVTIMSFTSAFLGTLRSQFSVLLSALIARNKNIPYLTTDVDAFDLDALPTDKPMNLYKNGAN